MLNFKTGIGYDVHRLVPDRKLILGGVEIPFEKGLLGHSDADVLIHAIIDSLIGAMGKGDIGRHFPDTDEKYHNIDSMLLLREVKKMLADENYTVGNIDSVIVAQRPKLSPFTAQMCKNISDALDIEPALVNIKAKTEEGLGFTGEGLGISAQAVCLLNKIS